MFEKIEPNDEVLNEIFQRLEESALDEIYVQSPEYEKWLIEFLDRHRSVCDWEERYAYDKPDEISDGDVKNIYKLHHYWNYKNPPKENYEFSFDDLFTIEPDMTISFNLKGKEYKFTREAGCGCYVHTIGVSEDLND